MPFLTAHTHKVEMADVVSQVDWGKWCCVGDASQWCFLHVFVVVWHMWDGSVACHSGCRFMVALVSQLLLTCSGCWVAALGGIWLLVCSRGWLTVVVDSQQVSPSGGCQLALAIMSCRPSSRAGHQTMQKARTGWSKAELDNGKVGEAEGGRKVVL